MADKSEWKTPSTEGEGKGDGHQYGRKPWTPEPIPIAGKTHLVRKRWDIGLLWALSPRIMMMNLQTRIIIHFTVQPIHFGLFWLSIIVMFSDWYGPPTA